MMSSNPYGYNSCYPDVMTVAQTARYLGMTERKIYWLISQHKIPAVEMGGEWRILRRTLMRWMRLQGHQHVNHLGPMR